MKGDISRTRSPAYPKLTLADALGLAKRLYDQAHRASIRPEVAIGPLGYSSMNGAALGTLATLGQYGLVDRERGGNLKISELAVKLIHPLNEKQEAEALRAAAVHPKIFSDIHRGGYHDCAPDVLANHLIQLGFTPEGARRAAAVYRANVDFAKLAGPHQAETEVGDGAAEPEPAPVPDRALVLDQSTPKSPSGQLTPSLAAGHAGHAPIAGTGAVLAQYSIPLGANNATLVFTGEDLSPDDFDALLEYIALFKKQFERKRAAQSAAKPTDIAVVNASST